jgi:NADH-quinone oxidoreductase subunit D
MSNPPDIVTGETEAPALVLPPSPAPGAPADEARRQVHDLWLSGTESPGDMGRFTSEGAQEMLADEAPPVLAEQMGRLVGDDYTTAVARGTGDTQIVNMGPQHPATHGVLRLQIELEGETIRRAKPIIGYLHTGMEKAAEALTFAQGPTNVTRMDYLSPFFNELCFSLAVERLLGVEVPPRAQAIRILMTELNRVASHLIWIATQGLDIGALSMMLYGWRERELCLAFFEKVTGLRMNHNYIRPGGVAADLPDGWEDDVAGILDKVPTGLADYVSLLDANPIFKQRTVGVGVITADECRAFGVTGPMLRAAGVPWDLRRAFPYSGIEKYRFDIPVGRSGDVYDRYRVRMEEMRQSLRLVEQVAAALPAGDYRTDDLKVTPPPRARLDQSMEALIHHFKLFTEGFKVPAGEVYQAVESPRGELGMYLVSRGGSKPWRLHVRGPSFANVQALPVMLADSLVADTVATVASADPVLGDVDR